jgi:hypothetical protein
VRPLTFVITAITDEFGQPDGYEAVRFRAVAPYENDPNKWQDAEWVDLETGRPIEITTEAATGGLDLARVKSYRDIANDHKLKPEAKSVDAEGRPCRRATRGRLFRRSVTAGDIIYIGKESHRLEEARAELIEGDFQSQFGVASLAWNRDVMDVLKAIPLSYLMNETGLSRRTIQKARNGQSQPRRRHQDQLITAAREWISER